MDAERLTMEDGGRNVASLTLAWLGCGIVALWLCSV